MNKILKADHTEWQEMKFCLVDNTGGGGSVLHLELVVLSELNSWATGNLEQLFSPVFIYF